MRPRYGLWLAVVLILLASGAIRIPWAYGYGYGGKKDPVIQAYKAINKALKASPMRWNDVEKRFGKIRGVVAKMDSDYQAGLVGPMEAAIQAGGEGTDQTRHAESLVDSFHRTFFFLIRHKLENAEALLQDFGKAKALVASAKNYYAILAPVVKKGERAADAEVRKAFGDAMKALGRPGAFGFGKKPPDPDRFRAAAGQIDKILSERF
ncbi:MAG: hypothetical protein ACE5IQ_05090 [Candidatus Methylomirabilales bacterium]